jgi:5'-nucleotidase
MDRTNSATYPQARIVYNDGYATERREAFSAGGRSETKEFIVRILVSNDDGISARGIRVLAQRLAEDAANEVFVCAPDRERSATGHALTLHKPLRVEEAHLDAKVKGAWYTTGTPSDGVKFAVGALLKEPIDYVISGINAGPNLGSEVLYSGTVSAAMEGAFLDIPSIAVSMGGSGNRNYQLAADFVARFIKILPRARFAKRMLLNINVPNASEGELKGLRVTKLGVRAYNDHFEKRVDPRGKVYYWLAGEAIEGGEAEDTDAWAVFHNYISLTPIQFNMTDTDMMGKMQHWDELKHLMEGFGVAAPVGEQKAHRESK